MMRFYQPHTEFYCGIDLHARNMHVCVVNRQGQILVHRKLGCDAQRVLQLLEPYRNNVVVSVECVYCWYWLADLCQQEGIEFVLGHALYMKAVHQGKTKNDRIDSEKIARLTQGGLLPMAYAYPAAQRGLRDLMRRRLRFVRQRAELYTHLHLVNTQANQPGLGQVARYKTRRGGIAAGFSDDDVQQSVTADVALIGHYDSVITQMEKHILNRAWDTLATDLRLLQTIPGIGPVIALTILYEIDTIDRFENRQQFASYCRLVRCRKESDGKATGTGGGKIGNAYLKWAFSEAVSHMRQHSARVLKFSDRLESKHGVPKGKAIVAHKLGRTIYRMLTKRTIFDERKFTGLND